MKNMTAALEKALGPTAMERVRLAGRIAQDMGMTAYLVGGCVRDLLLKRTIKDIDIGVVGDAVALGEAFAVRMNGRVVRMQNFDNAIISFEDGAAFDFATARRERYPKPAALPVVAPALCLEDDFSRRDFTINAMAIFLNPSDFGRLYDPYNGQKDLHNVVVRALHEKSFNDDPTRIYRACRFARRLGFSIEPDTTHWIKQSVKNGFHRLVDDHRLSRELSHILDENDPESCLSSLWMLGAMDAFHPSILRSKAARKSIADLEGAIAWWNEKFDDRIGERCLWILALMRGIPVDDRALFLKRFKLGGKDLIRDLERLDAVRSRLARIRNMRHSTVFRLLANLSNEEVLLLAMNERHLVNSNVLIYLTDLRFRKVQIKGTDLQEMGIEPGPEMGRILEKVRDAVMDGKVTEKTEQLVYAHRLSARSLRR